MESYINFIPALITLLVGLLLGGLFKKGTQKKIVEQAKSQADELLRKAQLEAEATKKEKMLQAKEHFIELKSKHDSAIHQREKRITEIETKVRQLQSVAHKEVKKNTDLQRKLEEQTSSICVFEPGSGPRDYIKNANGSDLPLQISAATFV